MEDPVEVYRVVLPWESDSKRNLNNRRIAILPFANISPDPNDDYFADGLTDEMIHVLSQMRELEVIARTSVMHYKNSEKKIKTIGKELNVGSVLEGSVRKSGKKIRVTAQLINSDTEIHEWSGSYDRELDDIFAIQSDIAKQIAGVLQVKLLKTEAARVEQKATESVDAYTIYLKAGQSMHERTPKAVREAMRLLQEAIDLDPRFSRAYASMSSCYSILLDYGQISASEALPKAREYGRMALGIDQNLAEAHASVALAYDHDFDSVNAEKEYQQAISINPNLATAHHWYAVSLTGTGRNEEAIREMKKARDADPLSPIIMTVVGSVYFQAGKYEEAWKQWEDTLKVEPGFFVLYLWRAIFHIKFSRYDEAKRELTRGLTFSPGHTRLLGVLGYAHAKKNDTAAARDVLENLLEARESDFVAGESISFVYAGLGERESFIEWLSIAVKERTVSNYLLRSLPMFDPFREDPEFKKLLREAKIES
ncbi:MAG: tetratricopeptide repeat protein [Thaumarchaeota archaeon]|nr:tetratricopeptide repeat protein [Nitrososphaerota archaeon]